MLTRNQVTRWLTETDPRRLQSLWRRADRVRQERVGDAIHLRGLIEISNICACHCAYCGIRADHASVRRYRMTADEILACARLARDYGCGTVVLQAGEDYGLSADWLADLIAAIKSETSLAITLSLGERRPEELRRWRQAGADRYLVRFETSNPRLYRILHPDTDRTLADRLALIETLQELGYETGSGFLIGVPGQSYDDLAEDLLLARRLNLHMIGVGPYVSHPETPLARMASRLRLAEGRQVPATVEMTGKVIALARLMCPGANIPSTTALATIDPRIGRTSGLTRGANVIMPNVTPARYRALYEIYPGKAGSHETAEVTCRKLKEQVAALGRCLGQGRGDSACFTEQKEKPSPAWAEAN